MITVGQIMKYATRKRYIEYNPVREIEKPKAKGKGKIDFMQPHEVRALLANADSDKFKMLFLMAIMTGMRQGELLGLQWGDIDWLNNQVCVRRTFNHGKFQEPKSDKSYRKIDLAPIVISELKKWKLQCPKGDPEKKETAGNITEEPKEFDLVYSNEEGNPIDAMNLMKRYFKPACGAPS